jgi:hypothetical protein
MDNTRWIDHKPNLSRAVRPFKLTNASEIVVADSPNIPLFRYQNGIISSPYTVIGRITENDMAEFTDIVRFAVFLPKSELDSPASNTVRIELDFAGYDLIRFRRFIDREFPLECPDHIAVELRQIECDQLKKLPRFVVDLDRENVTDLRYDSFLFFHANLSIKTILSTLNRPFERLHR